MSPDRPPLRLDSAYLVQIGKDQWELREAVFEFTCFTSGYKPGPLKFTGSYNECYLEAPKLGFHIDGIQPL